MVHVIADGESFVIVEFQSQNIKEVYGTLPMMMTADLIKTFVMGGTDVVKKSHDTATLVGKVRFHVSQSSIYIQGMVCQTTLITMVMVAVGSEIVTMMQIVDHTANPLAIDIAEQRDDLRLRSSTTSIHPRHIPNHRR